MFILYFIKIVHFAYLGYTGLLFVRILGSWFPEWQRHHWMQFVAFCTEPYLALFRRVLPPLGGVLDVSPILAFFVLRLMEMLTVNFILWLF